MYFLRLVVKNALRHKLRTTLTIVGIVVAITAFGLLRTIVDAWYAGANASSSARLVTRNAVSLVFALPLTYAQRVHQVPGVTAVSWANWFGGVYISERNFFPQFAVDAPTYLEIYPEFVLSAAERKAFLTDRQGAIVGRKLAAQYGWKLGDQIPLRGTIFPGTWTFNLRGIYDGATRSTAESQMLFHWAYLNESVKKRFPRRGDQIGVLIEQLKDPDQAAAVSQTIDATFKNSLAETLTETENAFQLGFVSMSEAILLAIQAVSFVVIVIIMAVMANTMAMTARERGPEGAGLRSLVRRVADLWRVAADRDSRGCRGHRAHLPAGQCLPRSAGDVFPDLLCQRRDGRGTARRGAHRGRRGRRVPGLAGVPCARRRRPARNRLKLRDAHPLHLHRP